MNTHLTKEQIDFYQENGYIIIEDFLTPEELETGGGMSTMRLRSAKGALPPMACWPPSASLTQKAPILTRSSYIGRICGLITLACAS